MRRANLHAALVVVVAALLAAPARADIPPDPDSVEAHCTLAEQCPDGVECPAGIRRDAGEVRECAEAMEAKGLRKRCQHGLYVGTAVYCRADAHGSWSPPATVGGSGSGGTSRGGCTRCAIAPEPRVSSSSWLVVLATVAAVLRRSVRRPAARAEPR